MRESLSKTQKTQSFFFHRGYTGLIKLAEKTFTNMYNPQ